MIVITQGLPVIHGQRLCWNPRRLPFMQFGTQWTCIYTLAFHLSLFVATRFGGRTSAEGPAETASTALLNSPTIVALLYSPLQEKALGNTKGINPHYKVCKRELWSPDCRHHHDFILTHNRISLKNIWTPPNCVLWSHRIFGKWQNAE